MSDRRGSDEDIARLLRLRVWAVVGLTPNQRRPSYGVGRFLLDQGIEVIPVNPQGDSVHGQPGVRTLSEIGVPVDVVDIFRRPEEAGAHVDQAIGIGAAAVWLQLGVLDTAAADRAEAAGLTVVMDHCPAIEGLDLARAVAESRRAVPARLPIEPVRNMLWTTCSAVVDGGGESVDGRPPVVDGE